jgi:hypothetical protein
MRTKPISGSTDRFWNADAFADNGLALAVNASGTSFLASDVTSFEGSFFGISIRAAMLRP